MGTRYVYNRHAERPVAVMWVLDYDNTLVDFSDSGYTFVFKIGAPGYQALLTKTAGIAGGVGSGVEPTGAPNIVLTWDVGELDIPPGVYDWQLKATISGLDRFASGTFQILNAIS